MNNIKFNYLYRDAGNHKVWGSEVFLNSGSLSLNVIDESIKRSLIDGQFFNPKYWKVKRLDFGDWDAEIDHAWNEFESIEITNDEPTIGYSVTEFLEIISMATKY